jgi:hypothetical protein
MLHYPFCNDTHDKCVTEFEWVQTLEEAETAHLSDADTEPETIDITDEEPPKLKKPRTAPTLTEDDLLALLTLGICKLASEYPDFLIDSTRTVSHVSCFHITSPTCECPVCHLL